MWADGIEHKFLIIRLIICQLNTQHTSIPTFFTSSFLSLKKTWGDRGIRCNNPSILYDVLYSGTCTVGYCQRVI